MPKGKLIQDTFEQLAELGSSTVKASAKAVAQTFNPGKLIEKATGTTFNQDKTSERGENGQKKPNHTPLDLDKLGSSFQSDDEAKLKILRSRLFQKVKRDDEELNEEKKQSKAQAEQQEQKEIQMKKQQLLKQQQNQSQGTPKGKVRKSILAPRKKIQETHQEMKPATGKS